MGTPRQYPIHKSLTDPILLWGGEWFLVGPWWTIIGGALWVTAITKPKLAVVALIVGLLGQKGLQKLAKSDPFWSKVFWRTRHYQSYYPAHTRRGGR